MDNFKTILIKDRKLFVREDGYVCVFREHRSDNTFKKGKPGRDGYLIIKTLGKSLRVHRLVACAYHGMDLDSPNEVHHKDRNRENAHPDNLEVLTPREHALVHKLNLFSLLDLLEDSPSE